MSIEFSQTSVSKRLKQLGIVALAALCLVLLVLVWVTQSRSGLSFLVSQLPATVKVAEVEGTLDDFGLRELRIETSGGELTLNDVRLIWNPFALLRGTVAVESLSAEKVEFAVFLDKSDSIQANTLRSGVDIPINILVQAFHLKHLNVSQDSAPVLELDQLEAKLSLIQNQLDIERFLAQHATQTVSLNGMVDLLGSPKGQVKLDYAVESMSAVEQFETIGSLHGVWEELLLKQSLSAPYQIDIQASLEDVLSENITWVGSLEILTKNALNAAGHSLEVGLGRLDFSGGYQPEYGPDSLRIALSGGLPIRSAEFETWQLAIDTELNDKTLSIRSFELIEASSENETNGQLNVQGEIEDLWAFASNDADASALNLEGQWSQVHWPLKSMATRDQKEPRLSASKGRFTLQGAPADYSLNVQSQGFWQTRAYDARLDANVLGTEALIKELVLNVGDVYLIANGSLGTKVDMKLDLNAPRLSHLDASVAGNLSSNLNIVGPREGVVVQGSLTGSALRWADYSLAQLDVQFDLPTLSLEALSTFDPVRLRDTALNADLNLLGLRQESNLLLNSVSLKLDGSLAEHELNINADLDKGTSLESVLVGNLSSQSSTNLWHAELSKFSVVSEASGEWLLDKPAQLILSSTASNRGMTQSASPASSVFSSLRVNQACMSKTTQSMCASLNISEAIQEFDASLNDFELSNMDRLLRLYDLSAAGQINGSARYSRVGSEPGELDAQFNSDAAQLLWVDSSGEEPVQRSLMIDSIKVNANQTDTFGMELVLVLENQDRVEFKAIIAAALESPEFRTATLNARAKLDIQDLSNLPPSLLNDVSLTGQLQAVLGVQGNLQQPIVSLRSNVTKASAKVRELGLNLQNIELQANSTSQSEVQIKGTLKSGEGTVNLNGVLSLSQSNTSVGPSLQLDLKGERVQLANTSDLQIDSGLALEAFIDASSFRASGDIIIEQAELDFQIPESAVLPSSDVVLLGQEEAAAKTSITLDIGVDVGDKTHIQAQGLDAHLAGKLRLRQRPNGIMRGDGQISINKGRYVAYGQELDIDSGVLIFDGGSIDDPSIDLKAQRIVGSTTAGVSVTGRASEPRLSLFSTPTMPDQDILAVLIFKKPVGDLASKDALTLLRIASSVSGGGPDRITQLTQSLEETLGLSELEVNLVDSAPGIVARKQLTSRFSVSYGYALLDATQSLFLRYRLSDHWSVKAELGADSGADFRYQVEY